MDEPPLTGLEVKLDRCLSLCDRLDDLNRQIRSAVREEASFTRQTIIVVWGAAIFVMIVIVVVGAING